MLLALLRLHARETVSLRSLLFFLLAALLSVFLLLAMPQLASSLDRVRFDYSISIVDPGRSIISGTLAGQLQHMNRVGQVYVETLESARARLDGGEILMIIELDEGFIESSLKTEERPPVKLWLNERMPAETAIFTRALMSLADSVTGIQSAYFAYADLIEPFYADAEGYNRATGNAFTQIAMWVLGRRAAIVTDETARLDTPRHVVGCLLSLLAMQTGLLLLMQARAERETGVQARLALSGAPWWLAPLSRQLVGTLWLAAACAPLLAGIRSFYPLARTDLIAAALLWLFLVTGLLCQAAGSLPGHGGMVFLGAWMGILAALLLGGCIYPGTLLPEFVRPLMKLSPAYWAYQASYRALGGELPGPGAGAAAALMAAAAAALLRPAWLRGLRQSRTGGAA